MTAAHPELVQTRRRQRGSIFVRDGTSDLSVALSTFSNDWAAGNDEYGLANLYIDGVFVDVGAHIGTVALAVLLDNPRATAIIVEPFPENMDLIVQTMAHNGLSDRVTFVTAAVGKADITYGNETADDRYVGNIGTHDGPTIKAKIVTLAQLVKMAGGRIKALKTDCEGGEWGLLRASKKTLSAVDIIFGEWHGRGYEYNGPTRLHGLLDATHHVTILSDDGGVGLFRATLR